MTDSVQTGRFDPLIPSCRDKNTRVFATGGRVKAFGGFAGQAERRLSMLNAADSKEDLMALPRNRFEALGGDRKGQFSIRINLQWRICFEWPEGASGPSQVEITDYHS